MLKVFHFKSKADVSLALLDKYRRWLLTFDPHKYDVNFKYAFFLIFERTSLKFALLYYVHKVLCHSLSETFPILWSVNITE